MTFSSSILISIGGIILDATSSVLTTDIFVMSVYVTELSCHCEIPSFDLSPDDMWGWPPASSAGVRR